MDARSFIVLDLDETLIHSLDAESKDELLSLYSDEAPNSPLSLRNRIHDVPLKGDKTITVVERPFLQEFLRDIFRYFECVIVWTAGKEHYANAIVDTIFKEKRPTAVYNWNHCRKREHSYDKPLRYLAEDPNIGADLNRTIIVDDRPENFADNPENGVVIPPFLPCENSARIDYALPILSDWLGSLVKRRSFKNSFKPGIYDSNHYLSEFF